MNEKETNFNLKYKKILTWIGKTQDEKCIKIKRGTFGRNSLKPIILNANNELNLNLTDKECKKVNRMLKKQINTNLNTLAQNLMFKLKEKDLELYKNVCSRKISFLEEIEILKEIDQNLKDCTLNEFKEINNKLRFIINRRSEEILRYTLDRIALFYNIDEIDRIVIESFKGFEKNQKDIIDNISKGTFDLDDLTNKKYMEKLCLALEKSNLGITSSYNLFNWSRIELVDRLTKTSLKYFDKFKFKVEEEKDPTIKQKYLSYLEKIDKGNLTKEEKEECFIYLGLTDKDKQTLKIRKNLGSIIDFTYICNFYKTRRK